jgi:hypothetical protein
VRLQAGPLSREVTDHGTEAACREHLDALDQGRLVGVVGRDDDLPVPGARGGQHRRQHPSHRAQRPVETELAEQHELGGRTTGQDPGTGEHRDRQRQVEAAALLGHRRR